jgi:chromosomal replication initiator protein
MTAHQRDWILPPAFVFNGLGASQNAAITQATSDIMGIPVEDICGPKRAAHIALARAVAIYVARDMTDQSLPQIGRYFGRDHSTVLHAIRRIEALSADPHMRATIDAVKLHAKIAGVK